MPHFIFIQQIFVLNILNMLYNLNFFSSKCRLFHIATLFGFCITHILNTGCAKIKKKSVAKRLSITVCCKSQFTLKFPPVSSNLCTTLCKTISRLLNTCMEEYLNPHSCGDFSLFLTIEFTHCFMTQRVCTEEICVRDSVDKIM